MPDRMTVFLDELLAGLDDAQRAEVEQACGQDPSCAFDLLETNNPALAQNSLETNMENLENQAIASENQILSCPNNALYFFSSTMYEELRLTFVN